VRIKGFFYQEAMLREKIRRWGKVNIRGQVTNTRK
jgi:hypothetical protein